MLSAYACKIEELPVYRLRSVLPMPKDPVQTAVAWARCEGTGFSFIYVARTCDTSCVVVFEARMVFASIGRRVAVPRLVLLATWTMMEFKKLCLGYFECPRCLLIFTKRP
jgi:hypothetical protein